MHPLLPANQTCLFSLAHSLQTEACKDGTPARSGCRLHLGNLFESSYDYHQGGRQPKWLELEAMPTPPEPAEPGPMRVRTFTLYHHDGRCGLVS